MQGRAEPIDRSHDASEHLANGTGKHLLDLQWIFGKNVPQVCSKLSNLLKAINSEKNRKLYKKRSVITAQ